ncbi:MAG: VaFE repeat-containing surface-anchored protein [Clostridia bacterium]|nr:VaFE repeat-containing surface-anchored protein [Clostridia bacterium]
MGKVTGRDINVTVSSHYGHELHTATVGGNTYPLFCVEYNTTSPSEAYLKARKAGSNADVITAAKWIFAGYYLEHGNSINWKDMAMCQKKVWSIMGSSTSWDFSDSDYENWCDTAEANMKKLNTKPSFDKTNVGTITAGTSKTFTDTNKVFKDYPAFTINKDGIKMVHSAGTNTLVVTVDKTCTQTSFSILNGAYYKTDTGDDDELLLYYPYGSESYQKLIYSAYYDPVSFSVVGNIQPLGDLKIKKVSEDGKTEGFKFTINGTNYTKTVSTDANGEAVLDYLVPGTYTVTEASSNIYEPQSTKSVTVQSNKTATISFSNVLRKGSLQVTKTSEDGINEGVKFRLTGTSLSGETINETASTNADGVATFKNILIGTGYVIEEVNTAIRYVIPDNQTTSIKWNEVTKASFTNTLKKFRVTVTKTDKEKGAAQGDATLAGAKYGLYDNGRLVGTYTTDAHGQFTTDYYICGEHWTIKEIEPSEGYLLDSTVDNVGASASLYTIEYNSTSAAVKEQVIKGNIAVIKHSDDGSTQIETPEPEAEFQVYLKSAGSFADAKASEKAVLDCDNDGFAQATNLPYGVYTVHQTKGKEGSEFMPDFDVFVSENGKTYKYLINNAPFQAYIKIIKTDTETGKSIPYAGAGFQIFDASGKKISMSFTYPKKTTVDTFYTNEEGYLLTPEKLELGRGYSLVEVTAPYGYVLDNSPVSFDVTRENSHYEDALTIVKVNKKNVAQKGVIQITKTGEVFASVENSDSIYTPVYEEQNLKNAVFEVYAAEDIATGDGAIRYHKGALIDEITTGEDGIAISKAIYLGKYKVTEKAAPDGFVKDTTEYIVELSYAGQNIKVTSTALNMNNQRQKVSVSLAKSVQVDETFGIGKSGEVESIQFGLFAAETITASDGSEIPENGLITFAYCDENGKVAFDCDLPLNAKYYVKELSADNHYIIDESKYEFDAAYKGQDESVIDIQINDGQIIENKLLYGSIKGTKTDRESGKPIAGVVFGLFKSDAQEYNEQTAVLTVTTDKNGAFEFAGVPYGSYFIKELKAADGYLENSTLYTLDITENEQVIEYNIVNDRIPELKTSATVNGKKTMEQNKVLDIYDIVEYQHLVPETEYTIKGILMDKKTGKPLLINGKTVTAEITFVPKEPSGSLELVFKVDSSYLTEDTEIVVFETLYKDGTEIASHCDLKDKEQTVKITMPKPKQTTKVPDTGDNLDKRTIYTMAAASALAILVIVYNLLRKRKKSDKEDDKHEH